VSKRIDGVMKIERVLFPTDFSERSIAALEYASALAASFDAVLHILYVDDLRDLIAKSAYAYPSLITAADRSEVKAKLEEVVPTLVGVAYVHHFIEGEPSVQICALAKSAHIDLIVMSSHGRTGFARLVMGSIAENVVRNATCPVLIVRQPNTDQADTKLNVAACNQA
jgi:nucleotide-binding universal stress UspA family protein